jgi:sugar transferase (PEP-CTERM/EpsH1 system associated)
MKILFACHRFPFPPNRGGKIRPFNMIKHLSQKHEMFVASVAHSHEELEEGAGLKDCAAIFAEVMPEKLRWLQAVRAMPSSTPSSVAYFKSSCLRQRVEQAVRRVSFDAVIVHCAFAAQYVSNISARFRLMDFGDLDSGKWLDYAKWKPFPTAAAYALESKKLRRYEREIAQRFDYCTLTTEGELEEFSKLETHRPSKVIPNGVDANYFRPETETTQPKTNIVFLGRMDYFPNIDGITYFAKKILPKIRVRVPSVTLSIIGSDPVSNVKRLSNIPGVTVTGHVPDVRPYLRDAAVSIAPLRMARGTQNKILESMAMGIPVVATRQAAKGIQAVRDKHLLVADGDHSFAAQVVTILEDANLQRILSSAGRKRVEEVHAWPNSMRLLDGVLEKAYINGGSTNSHKQGAM